MFKYSLSNQLCRSVFVKTMSYLSVENVTSAVVRDRCISKLRSMAAIDLGETAAEKKAAVLVPLCVDNGKLSLLYTLRSMNLSSHKGDVSFPGGKFDVTDASLTETALRETEEELGIPREMVDVWCEIVSLPSRNYELSVTPIVGFIKDYNKIKLRTNPSEVEEAFTVPIDILCDPQYFGINSFKSGFVLPVYMGGNHKIWGLTAIVTHILLSNLLPPEVYTMYDKCISTPKKNEGTKSKV